MSGPLSIGLTGDISKFQSAMARAGDIAAKHALDISSNFQGAASKINLAFAGIEGLGKLPGQLNAAKAAALGFAATGAGIVAAYALVSSSISQANAQLDRFIKLGSNAERASVGVEFFQRFTEAAEKAKLDVAEIEAALKRAGSVVTPKFEQEDTVKKRLNDLFESGYTGSFQSKGLADYNAAANNEQRIRAAVTAMQELRDLGLQTAAIEIGDKLFGSEVADRIRSGRLDIDAIAASLDRRREDLITQAQVEQAAEFRDRLAAAYTTIDEFLHVSIALEGSGRAVLDVWLMIAEGVAKATVNAGNFYTKIQEMQGPLANYLSTAAQIVGGTAQIFAGNLNDKIDGTRTIYDKPIGPEQPGAPPNALTGAPSPPRRPLDFYTDPTSYGRGAAKAGRAPKAASTPSESLDQVQSFINGIERSTEALKAETDAIGKGAAERLSSINVAKLEATARQQGITLTADQIAKVKALSAATAEYREKLEEAREAQQELRSIGGEVLKGIANDARGGATAMEILTGAVGRLASRLQDKALDGLADMLFGKSGGSGGSGILGGLFGGSGGGINVGLGLPWLKFAEGGHVTGPGTGTSDSILARVSNGEFIVREEATRRHRSTLEAINSGKVPAFATGGLVGGTGSSSPGSAPDGARAPLAAPGAAPPNVVTIAPVINLTAAGGTADQNADLASRVGQQLEGHIRSIVVGELRTALRPNGMLERMR